MARRKSQSVVRVVDAGGAPVPAKGMLFYTERTGEDACVPLDQVSRGVLSYALEEGDQPLAAVLMPQEGGHWVTRSEECWDGAEIVCEEFAGEDEHSWWHRLLGDHLDDPERGRGIKIGVVDSGFAEMDGLERVVRVDVDEGPPMLFSARGFWRHGEVVCRIIGDRNAPPAATAIAPGADLFFCNASFAKATIDNSLFRFPDDEGSPDDDLDPRLVNRAIDTLSADCEVDIINLSLGSFAIEWEESGLGEAIRAARERGTIVIAAAGNEPEETAAFPAVLDECIGVGAYGLIDWGPPESICRYFSEIAEDAGELDGMDLFYHPDSARGIGVDVLAPGVGVLTSRAGGLAFDVTGTSFAAPIVSALLAVALAQDATYLSLPRDEARARYAEDVLGDLCRDGGFDFGGGHKPVSF